MPLSPLLLLFSFSPYSFFFFIIFIFSAAHAIMPCHTILLNEERARAPLRFWYAAFLFIIWLFYMIYIIIYDMIYDMIRKRYLLLPYAIYDIIIIRHAIILFFILKICKKMSKIWYYYAIFFDNMMMFLYDIIIFTPCALRLKIYYAFPPCRSQRRFSRYAALFHFYARHAAMKDIMKKSASIFIFILPPLRAAAMRDGCALRRACRRHYLCHFEEERKKMMMMIWVPMILKILLKSASLFSFFFCDIIFFMRALLSASRFITPYDMNDIMILIFLRKDISPLQKRKSYYFRHLRLLLWRDDADMMMLILWYYIYCWYDKPPATRYAAYDILFADDICFWYF